MDHFSYRNGELFCEDVAVERIADSLGTPLYVYSKATLLAHYRQLADAFAPVKPLICYSVKTNGNINVLRVLAGAGAGFDVVSGGELFRAQAAGGDPDKCVYAGVGKTDAEIRQAVAAGIGLFNVESEAELSNVDAIARQMGKGIRGALRINPDVDPHTHAHITTGKKETKFGIDLDRAGGVFRAFAKVQAADGAPGMHLTGVHIHIGSQITEVEPYVEAVRKVLALIDELRRDGLTMDWLDLGGGFGINYENRHALPASAFAAALLPMLLASKLQIAIEPGRYIAGNAGLLMANVLYLKAGGTKKFVIVDAGMNDLIRPMLYDAFHFIWPTRPGAKFIPPADRTDVSGMAGLETVDVVGPICESGDFFAHARAIPPVQRGQRLAIFSAGAYSFAMSSQYNARPRPAEVLVDGATFRVIRKRETYDDLIALEK
ncbi:MAG: diaminopimelate decarboxylase [Phycisphaerae bacterium]|nr:diaminopimelate decarboxylase [Phycisphaerae bacterium]